MSNHVSHVLGVSSYRWYQSEWHFEALEGGRIEWHLATRPFLSTQPPLNWPFHSFNPALRGMKKRLSLSKPIFPTCTQHLQFFLVFVCWISSIFAFQSSGNNWQSTCEDKWKICSPPNVQIQLFAFDHLAISDEVNRGWLATDTYAHPYLKSTNDASQNIGQCFHPHNMATYGKLRLRKAQKLVGRPN